MVDRQVVSKASGPCDPFLLPLQFPRVGSLAKAVRFLSVVLPDLGPLPCRFGGIGHMIDRYQPADPPEVLGPMNRCLEVVGLAQAKNDPSLIGSPFGKPFRKGSYVFLCQL
jgi:hypothetical protein